MNKEESIGTKYEGKVIGFDWIDQFKHDVDHDDDDVGGGLLAPGFLNEPSMSRDNSANYFKI